jgi:hypothetical protein
VSSGHCISRPITENLGRPSSLPQHLPCKLEELTLVDSTITASQLTRFLALPTPHLTLLWLDDVRGISNNDFLSFLFSVAPTLAHINVTICPMPRTSNEEELALDAAMPMLESLCSAKVDGAQASAFTLSRKPAGPQESGPRVPSSIVIEHAVLEDLSLEQVKKAMCDRVGKDPDCVERSGIGRVHCAEGGECGRRAWDHAELLESARSCS